MYACQYKPYDILLGGLPRSPKGFDVCAMCVNIAGLISFCVHVSPQKSNRICLCCMCVSPSALCVHVSLPVCLVGATVYQLV